MTSRGPRSTDSSRDPSPELHAEPYDPFHDPIELSHLRRPSFGALNSHSSHEESPEDERRGRAHGRSHSGAYLIPTQSSSQYAPLSGCQESPHPSMRTERESMYSATSRYQTKAMDADTQALVDKRVGELAQWHIHWTTPAIISSLFVAGVLGAVGHHLFYTHLNGQPATEQLTMVRYGTALAFFTKSMLVSCVIVCYRQRIWHTLRSKAMTINGIDGLFSATEDPTMFFLNWEMVRNGKLATFMAICSWLVPIASVLSPASLTSQPRPTSLNTTCDAVATLNLTREAVFNFREEQQSNSRGNSLIYYNTTDPAGLQEGYFDYYDQPSKIARRLAFSSAYLKTAQPRQKAAIDFCGTGYNCTYSINFMAPGYKCDDVTATPSANFISPRSNTTAYKLAASYHSMGAMLRSFLRGDIKKTSDTFIITRSDISETRLMDGRTSYPQPDLMSAVQSLFEDMLLTLLSEPTLMAAESVPVPCVKSRVMTVYVYLPRSLWIGYAIAVAITLFSIVVGSLAIWQNGVASDTLFSRILVTTRNPTLDHLSVGACLGGDPFPKELRKTKLRFGVLIEEEPREGPLGRVEHCCFGTRGETGDIVRGNNYAGLRRWMGKAGSEDEKRALLADDEG